MKKTIALCAVILSACATAPLWEKPGASAQQFEMDKGQCQAQAFSVPFAPLMQAAIVFNSCMRGRGWYQVQG